MYPIEYFPLSIAFFIAYLVNSVSFHSAIFSYSIGDNVLPKFSSTKLYILLLLILFVILLYFKLQECNKKAPATAEAISNTKSMKNKVEKRNF